jgi:hemerythrin-like domain-containing protein
MRPSEVRQRILDDHQLIQVMVSEIRDLALRIQAGEQSLSGKLRERGRNLYECFCQHIDLEDVILVGALRDTDSRGEERAEELRSEHREQREVLTYLLERLLDPTQQQILMVHDLLNFTAWICDDIRHEEETLLHEDLLRDDVIGIRVNTG